MYALRVEKSTAAQPPLKLSRNSFEAVPYSLQASTLRIERAWPLWPWLHPNFKANQRGITANSEGTMAMATVAVVKIEA